MGCQQSRGVPEMAQQATAGSCCQASLPAMVMAGWSCVVNLALCHELWAGWSMANKHGCVQACGAAGMMYRLLMQERGFQGTVGCLAGLPRNTTT